MSINSLAVDNCTCLHSQVIFCHEDFFYWALTFVQKTFLLVYPSNLVHSWIALVTEIWFIHHLSSGISGWYHLKLLLYLSLTLEPDCFLVSACVCPVLHQTELMLTLEILLYYIPFWVAFSKIHAILQKLEYNLMVWPVMSLLQYIMLPPPSLVFS